MDVVVVWYTSLRMPLFAVVDDIAVRWTRNVKEATKLSYREANWLCRRFCGPRLRLEEP